MENSELIPVDDTRDDYHSDTSRVSKSGLDLIRRSPLHYWARYLSTDRPIEPPKKHYVVGSITNDVLLVPDGIEKSYAIVPQGAPKRPTAAQINAAKPSPETLKAIAWWDEFNAGIGGRQVVEAKDYDVACRMRDTLWAHPGARFLLAAGVAEKTILFEDYETGALCKCRPDFHNTAVDWLVDLKTTTDASPEGFGRSAYNYRYHVQAAFYSDGKYQATDVYPKGFAFVAIEKEYPYAVGIYAADENTIELGNKSYMEDLRTYVACKESNVWPGYPNTIEPLQMPGWALKRL